LREQTGIRARVRGELPLQVLPEEGLERKILLRQHPGGLHRGTNFREQGVRRRECARAPHPVRPARIDRRRGGFGEQRECGSGVFQLWSIISELSVYP
jgi:hypothetical protein